MNYPFGIIESLDTIFGGVLVGAVEDGPMFNEIIKTGRINYSRFTANFPSNIFQDKYAIFYSILVSKNIKVFNIEQLKTIIDNNRDLILDSPYVNLDSMERVQNGNAAGDDEKIEAMKLDMIDSFVELSNRFVSEDQFNSACEVYKDWFKNNFMLETAQNMTRIMSDAGFEDAEPNRRRQYYHGIDDCKKYYNKRVNILNEISNSDKLKVTVLDENWYRVQQQSEAMVDDKALMTVGIKKIDDSVGELRRSNMLGILGPPKGGKTRFTNYLVQRALSLGLNVCVWPLEGTSEEWIAMQKASYIARKYNVHLDSKKILQRKFGSEQEKTLVMSATLEMVADPSYGRLSFIESAAYVEDFLQILEAHYQNANPFDVIVIDSLVNILSRTGKNKVDRISSAYMLLKSFISTGLPKPALAIVPAQLKQEVVDYLRSHPNETLDVTSGGESAETIRSPDEVLGLFSSKEERAAGFMKIYSVASRHSENFTDFQARAYLGCCHFQDE